MNELTTFPDRVRFNWGFHDAQADVREGRATPAPLDSASPIYAAGYRAGRNLAERGIFESDSTRAWDEFTAEASRALAMAEA